MLAYNIVLRRYLLSGKKNEKEVQAIARSFTSLMEFVKAKVSHTVRPCDICDPKYLSEYLQDKKNLSPSSQCSFLSRIKIAIDFMTLHGLSLDVSATMQTFMHNWKKTLSRQARVTNRYSLCLTHANNYNQTFVLQTEAGRYPSRSQSSNSHSEIYYQQ